MKKLFLLLPFILAGCQSLTIPDDFKPAEIRTSGYTLAAWIRDSGSPAPVRIYIEGDGHAFYSSGKPTSDPTPKGTFFRKIAFGDPNPNVAYLARPCQFVMSANCKREDWTTDRFSEAIVASAADAVKQIAKGREVVLIGYSGGALLSGLVIERTDVPVRRWITVAGLLNHEAWTRETHLAPLVNSLNLKALPRVEQVHYIGAEDPVIPKRLFSGVPNAVTVPHAEHDAGFEPVLAEIYR